MSVRVDSAALRKAIEQQTRPAFERGAIALLGRLEQNIQAGERSGIHHPENPRQSSAPGEYPQEQTGDLLNSLDFRVISNTRVEVGAINNPPEYAVDLETFPEDQGGRRFLTRTVEEAETRDAIREGMIA
jgi:hypothetical protein